MDHSETVSLMEAVTGDQKILLRRLYPDLILAAWAALWCIWASPLGDFLVGLAGPGYYPFIQVLGMATTPIILVAPAVIWRRLGRWANWRTMTVLWRMQYQETAAVQADLWRLRFLVSWLVVIFGLYVSQCPDNNWFARGLSVWARHNVDFTAIRAWEKDVRKESLVCIENKDLPPCIKQLPLSSLCYVYVNGDGRVTLAWPGMLLRGEYCGLWFGPANDSHLPRPEYSACIEPGVWAYHSSWRRSLDR